MASEEKIKKPIYKKWWFWLIVLLIIGGIGSSGSSENTTPTSSNYQQVPAMSSDKSSEPDEIELMTYAQEVLKDNLISPKYSSYKGDYTFIGTGLRYKIEGKVNNDKFWMIIQFTDNTYTYYDLILLQVGQEMIYKK